LRICSFLKLLIAKFGLFYFSGPGNPDLKVFWVATYPIVMQQQNAFLTFKFQDSNIENIFLALQSILQLSRVSGLQDHKLRHKHLFFNFHWLHVLKFYFIQFLNEKFTFRCRAIAVTIFEAIRLFKKARCGIKLVYKNTI
jgi:hypothetical protein